MRVRTSGASLLFLAALALSLGAAGRADAGVITWGPATTISGDADVSTDGVLIAAFNTGGPDERTTTVNGVTFATLALHGNVFTSGNFTFSHSNPNPSFLFNDSVGSSSPPFSTLSLPYQRLLASFAGGAPFTLTISGLAVGFPYEFEWWSSTSSPALSGILTTATAGNGVSLNLNTTGQVGGVGQFAVGTFTADDTQEVIAFTGGPLTFLDGFQLREIVVPEPASLALFALGGLGLVGWRRWRQRRPARAVQA
jgi:hypothetical protein